MNSKYSMSKFNKISMIFGGFDIFTYSQNTVLEKLVYTNSSRTSNEKQSRRFYYTNNAQYIA
jgi:hypothetical protein